MKDCNFLKENNARHFWHPMTSPEDSATTPPKITPGPKVSASPILTGTRWSMRLAGCGMSIWAIPVMW